MVMSVCQRVTQKMGGRWGRIAQTLAGLLDIFFFVFHTLSSMHMCVSSQSTCVQHYDCGSKLR